MSLINEALKKAQKQRQEAAALPATPGQAEPPPPPIPPKAPPASPSAPEPEPAPVHQMRRDRAAGGRGKLFLIGGGVLAVVFAGWWAFSGSDAPIEVAASASPRSDSTNHEAPKSSVEIQQPAAARSEIIEVEVASVETSSELDDDTSSEVPVTVVFETRAVAGQIAGVELETGSEVVEETRKSIDVAVTSPEPDSDVVDTPVRPMPEPNNLELVEKPEPTPIAPPIDSSPEIAVVKAEEPVPTPNAQTSASSVDETVEASPSPALASRSSEPEVVIVTEEESGVGTASDSESVSRADPAVLAFLETAKVTGVRASSTDPKVLMNNRVYRLNDLIDRDLQIRITVITGRELKFTDAQGFVYTKGF